MSYLSLMFILFVLIVIIVYYLVPKSARGIILLCASIIYYLTYDVKYIIFLLFVAITTFITAKKLNKFSNPKLLMYLCLFSNILLWAILKILPWTIGLFNKIFSLFGANPNISLFDLIAPIGISYYLLKAISYLIDVYKKKIKSEKYFYKYLLYLCYFPTIVQGPISRYDDLKKELFNIKVFSFDNFIKSLLLIIIGLIKKMVIADRLGIFVNNCFSNYLELDGIILYLGAIFYTIQIYMDFSGCVDICRGVSKLFNIELINNFNRPYLSKSIKEFWGKWHISLSSFLKDYIYIPLGGNRCGKLRKYINIIITFLVSALWHGAGFSFIFWGLLHGIYQVFGDITKKLRIKIKQVLNIKENSFSERLYQTIITFNLVLLGWIFFRSTSFISSIKYITNMFSTFNIWVLFDKSIYSLGISQNYFILLFIHIFIIFILEIKYKSTEEVIDNITNMHIFIRWIIYLVFIYDVILFGVYGTGYDISGFMYGGF